jgi:hypothetical protein
MKYPLKINSESILFVLFLSLASLFLLAYAALPIFDPDFWWHLKTGELMSQRGWLLQSDPFTFVEDDLASTREQLVLKGYWLWQIITYRFYVTFGLHGIFLVKLFSAVAMFGVVGYEMYLQRVNRLVALSIMALGFILLSAQYPLERPQVFSFVFATVLLGFLTKIREGGRFGLALPLLMVIWANVHGGFLIGDLILLCFAVGALFEYRHDVPRLQHILLWSVFGVAASLINPTGALVFGELFTLYNSELMDSVIEYRSTWRVFQSGQYLVAILWLLMALYGFCYWISRRHYFPELLVALFLGYLSCAHNRNIGFFALAMLPMIARNVQCSFPKFGGKRHVLGLFIVVLCMTGFLWQGNKLRQSHSSTRLVSSWFPEQLSEFILSSGIEGKMLNHYDFGGYLIWKLYPDYLVFIDGRGISQQVHSDWMALGASSLKELNGRKKFEVLLDQYDIDFVVQPLIQFETGRLVPLLKFLLVKSDWTPVYVDRQSWILVRKTVKNSVVINRYKMGKREFNNRIISHLQAALQEAPSKITLRVALAEMLTFVGRYVEAERQIALISDADPSNKELLVLRNQLAVLSGAKRQ